MAVLWCMVILFITGGILHLASSCSQMFEMVGISWQMLQTHLFVDLRDMALRPRGQTVRHTGIQRHKRFRFIQTLLHQASPSSSLSQTIHSKCLRPSTKYSLSRIGFFNVSSLPNCFQSCLLHLQEPSKILITIYTSLVTITTGVWRHPKWGGSSARRACLSPWIWRNTSCLCSSRSM